MNEGFLRRFGLLVIFLLGTGAFAGGVWRYAYLEALDQLAQRGEADLKLATDRLTGQLQLFQQLAVLMAEHPTVAKVLGGQDAQEVQSLLQQVVDKTAARDTQIVDVQGRVLVSATNSKVRDVSKTPHFIRAKHGAMGEHHAVRGAGPLRDYYFAAPIFDSAGSFMGAFIVTAKIEKVEAEWRGAGPAVIVTDRNGVVFITNRSELLFWQRDSATQNLGPKGEGPEPLSRYMVGAHEIWSESYSAYVPQTALHLSRFLPEIDMSAEVLIDIAYAQRLAWLQATVVAAVCLAFGAMLFLATERRRTLSQANAQLEGRVANRTAELSTANTRLRREVVERQEAEAALTRAQADLVQAGKLSALGQMSAGISHELNQPLMAIQQYSDNGAQFLTRGKYETAGENLARISTLARRMARIIKNLRAFARQESEPMARVDCVGVVATALEMMRPALKREKVKLQWRAPRAAIYVLGGEVRLGQVIVNLVSNAIDAMSESDEKILEIKIEVAERVCILVCDTGPGIKEPEKIFDPFYSTKVVGGPEGMGLGLSISYGLVQSFGGAIKGQNAQGGGAIFSVELEPWQAEVAA